MTIRRLRLIAFAGFLLLVAASVGVTLWALRAQQNDALVINLAGRQRMLIQQMALETLGVQTGANPVYRQTLHQTADTFEQMLDALIAGGPAPYGEGTTISLPATPANETQILAQLETVRATWREVHLAIHAVLQNDPQSAAFAEAAATVERLSPGLLAQMDEAVRLYETEARRKVTFVQAVQLGFLAAAALLLIIALAVTERRILGPIARLGEAARRIGAGDLETPVSVIGLRELDQLAHSLDEMRQKLGVGAEAQAALLGLSRRLLAAQDEHEVAECAVEVAASALHTDFSALVLPDAEDRLLTRAVRGWPADFAGRFELGRSDASQTGYTILHGHPIAVGDYSTEMAFTVPPVVFEHGVVSGLSVPMFLEGRVVGAILIHSRMRRRFGEDEIRLLSLVANQTAVALEKTWSLAAERRRMDELAALHAVAAIGIETTRVDTLIERAVQIIGETLHPDYFGIGLVDETAGVLRVCRSTQSVQDEFLTIPLGEGVAGQAVATGQPQRIPDISREPAYLSVNPGTRSELCVPLKIGQRTIGVINVESKRLNAFSEADEHLMMTLAGQLATAIEKARLFQAEQRHAQEAETLRQAGAAVVATLQPDETIARILEQLMRVVPYDSASVLLWTEAPDRPGEGYLEIVGGRGWPDPAVVVGLRFPVPGDNPNTVVIQQRRPHILGDAPAAHAPFREDPHSHIRSWLGIPLVVRERVIGMLAIDSTQPDHFTPDHARLANAFADQVAIAVENARLFQAEQRGREAAAALLDITQVAGSSLELKQVLRHVAQRTAEACRANRCTIFLLDEAGEVLQPVMSQFADGHADSEQWQAFKATTADQLEAVPLFRDAIRERRPALLDDAARTDLVPLKWTQPFGIQKMLVVPLLGRDQVMGLMALDHSEAACEFTPEQIDLALTIGGQVTSAIANARLYAEVGRRAEQLRALHEASRALAGTLRLEAMLQTLVETARLLVNARYAALAVLDAEGTRSVGHFYTAGLTEAERQQIGDPPQGRGMLGVLLREGVPVRINDLARDPRASGFPPHHPPMTTFMGVPISARGIVLGSLYFTDQAGGQPFSQEDENLVVGLAADAAIAIENARLFGELERLAITDELTGLPNRRHFSELAGREFARARRYRRPLSAILLDIDHFKRVNDRHGHAVGDEVLRGVAARCRSSLREIDIPGRYGGEEFVVLLPENDLGGARAAAERLRQCVAETPIDTSRGALKITISLGVAAMNADCPDLAALLNQADAAMYRAKAAGRNRLSN